MPKTKPVDEPTEVTTDDAMELLGLTTPHGVTYLIRAGKLPGARKVNPGKQTSAWLIPVADIRAYLQAKEKQAEAAKASA